MKKKNLLVGILILTMITMFSIPMTVFAVAIPTETGNGIVPTYVAGNDNNTGDFKIDAIPSNGEYDINMSGTIIGKIIISNATNKTFDWAFKNVQGYVTKVTSINVKAGNGYFAFYYGTNGETSDTLLFSPKNQNNEGQWADISHVSFFFSTQTTPPPTEGTITVTKDVIYAGHPGLDLYDPQEFAYTYISEDDETISGSGIVSEATSSSITLPLGTYTFTEIGVNGVTDVIYTGEETSVTKTLNLNNLTRNVEFVNSIPVPTMGSITVTKDVIYAGHPNVDLDDSHAFTFIYQEVTENPQNLKIANMSEGLVSELISGSGIVSETTSSSITLPFGTYIFTETDLTDDNYTGVTTSVTKTINLNNLTRNVKFVNSIPVPTMGSITVTKDVIYADYPDVNLDDSHVFLYTYKEINTDKSPDEIISGSGIVSEGNPSIENLPFGKYKFIETDITDDGYTGVTTSVIRTINLNNLTKNVEFVNSIPVPTEGTVTVTKDVQYEDGTDLDDSHAFPFTYQEVTENSQSSRIANMFEGLDSELISGSGIVSETTSSSIILPFGTYIFIETDVIDDNYAGKETSFTVTLGMNNLHPQIEFINTIPNDTQEDPGTPVTPRNPNRTTPVLTPIVDEPVALVDTPIVETPIVDEPAPLADIPDPNVPQTGDTNNILLLLGLLFASGTGIAVLGRRKENAGK